MGGEFGCVFSSESWKNAPQFATQNNSKNHIFFSESLKNAPQFATQNPPKYHIFFSESWKKRTSICDQKSPQQFTQTLLAKKGAFFFFIAHNVKILEVFSWGIGLRFFGFVHNKKTYPNSPCKIQKGAFFCQKKKLAVKYKLLMNTRIYFIEKVYFQNQ